jgi:hypothetical protein
MQKSTTGKERTLEGRVTEITKSIGKTVVKTLVMGLGEEVV